MSGGDDGGVLNESMMLSSAGGSKHLQAKRQVRKKKEKKRKEKKRKRKRGDRHR